MCLLTGRSTSSTMGMRGYSDWSAQCKRDAAEPDRGGRVAYPIPCSVFEENLASIWPQFAGITVSNGVILPNANRNLFAEHGSQGTFDLG